MALATVVQPPSDITLTLIITPTEARVLKAMVQNQLGTEEDPIAGELRRAIWEALLKVEGV